ncbi:hypothetical protein Q8F55_006124 [Vanrija albida]|uniref:Uncharacterized protein n=1 Tax=Vanrija albida TaxID=181172 RepID=A0ABR3PWA9_9TREE
MPSPIYLKLDSSSLSRLVVALNRCTVRHLSVTFTPPPTSSALLALLGTLEIRGLHTLQIFGKLSPDTVPILADYLASPRSAGLRVLRLDRGECTVRDLEPLADAIEANGSVQKVWTE